MRWVWQDQIGYRIILGILIWTALVHVLQKPNWTLFLFSVCRSLYLRHKSSHSAVRVCVCQWTYLVCDSEMWCAVSLYTVHSTGTLRLLFLLKGLVSKIGLCRRYCAWSYWHNGDSTAPYEQLNSAPVTALTSSSFLPPFLPPFLPYFLLSLHSSSLPVFLPFFLLSFLLSFPPFPPLFLPPSFPFFLPFPFSFLSSSFLPLSFLSSVFLPSPPFLPYFLLSLHSFSLPVFLLFFLRSFLLSFPPFPPLFLPPYFPSFLPFFFIPLSFLSSVLLPSSFPSSS